MAQAVPCSLAAGLIRHRISIFIERKISTTHGAGEGPCRHAENSVLNEAGVVTRLVSPLSLLFLLHRQISSCYESYMASGTKRLIDSENRPPALKAVIGIPQIPIDTIPQFLVPMFTGWRFYLL